VIYLDHNATTRCDERVVEAMLPYLNTMYGNPSSLYKLGRIARSAIDTAREQISALIDAAGARIVFTSGGTEANALALANARHRGLAVSAIEHPSIFENAAYYKHWFRDLQTIEVNGDGLVSLPLEKTSWQTGDMVSVMLANNETGVIQDLAAISEALAERGLNLHTDAVQALGKIPVSFKTLGVNLMSLSSHKIYGPKGCGALVVSEDFVLKPSQRGGDQEHGWRAGTENVAAIVGFGKAADLAKSELGSRQTRMLALRTRLEQSLRTIPGLVIFAEKAKRIPNTVQFGIPGISGEMLLMQLDQRNIAVSSGSACSASSGEISPVLTAMGVDVRLARSAIRVSLGKDNNESEIDQFVDVLKASIAN
jgi:cysteine desulfurase